MAGILKMPLGIFLLTATRITIIMFISINIVNVECAEGSAEKLRGSFRDMAVLQAADPFSMPPVGEQLSCSKVGLNCPAADCQWLDWYVEYNKTIVNATALQEIQLSGSDRQNVGAVCFSRCQSLGSNCTAYTFNQQNGICRLFGVFRLRQINKAQGWNLGYRTWPAPTILGEWIVTREVRPFDPPFRQVTLNNSTATWMTCLDLCAQIEGQAVNSSRCIVAAFDLDSKNCSLYTSFNNRRTVVQPRVVVMQHYSSFTGSNAHRFYDLGNIAPNFGPPQPEPETEANSTQVSTSFDTDNIEDCFNACLQDSWYCVLVTVTTSGQNSMQCTLYSFIPERFESGQERPVESSDPDSNFHYQTKSYLLSYPDNYNTLHRLPYFFQIQGIPLYEVAVGGLHECWGRALDFLNGPRAPWWWLSYNSTSQVCSLYPEQITGIEINPARNSPEGPLYTFSNRRPVLSSTIFYGFDTFWISPGEINGQILGQHQGQRSVENCLQLCVNSSRCAGIARVPRENTCIFLAQAEMDAIINRNETDPPVVYTMEIFEKRRDLRPLEDTQSPYRCYPRAYLDNIYSTVNRSNPFLKGPRLDQFRRSLPLNQENEWLEPHGANFNGSSQLKFPSSFSQSNLQFNSDLKINPLDSSLPRPTQLKQSSGGRHGFRQIIFQRPGRDRIEDLADNVDLPHKRVAGPAADTEICMILDEPCPDQTSCSERCPAPQTGPGSDLRFLLSLIKDYVNKSRKKNKRKSRQPGETQEENAHNTCKCFGTPEPPSDDKGKLIHPDEFALQEDCNGKRIGDRCAICCLQAYRSRNPFCRCSSGVPTEWDDNNPRCVPTNTCVTSRRTWGGQEMVKLPMRNCNNFLYFAMSFNYRRKIPFYGVSKWTPLHRSRIREVTEERGSYVNYPCTEELTSGNRRTRLSFYQLKQADYTRLNKALTDRGITHSKYDHGHLVAVADSGLYNDAVAATMRRVNLAPQDHWSNNAWNRVEAEVRNVLNETVEEMVPPFRTGYIITGTCWSNDVTNPIPGCYWKIVCTRALVGESVEWRVAAFFHTNIISENTEMHNQRRREMYQKRPQQELWERGFFGPVTLDEFWDDVGSSFDPTNPDELSDPASIQACKRAPFEGFPDITFPSVAAPPEEGASTEPSTTSTTERDELRAESDNYFEAYSDSDADDDANPEVDSIPNTRQASTSSRVLFREDPNVPLQSELRAPPICGKKVVGYVTAWSDVPFTSNISDYLTHAIFTYVEMLENGTLQVGSHSARNPNSTASPGPATIALETQKAYVRMYEMKLAKQGSEGRLRTMFSVGGWDNSQYFSQVIADPLLTQNFIRSVNEILDYWNMDGIDIDYEYPVTGGATPGTPQDRANFVLFLNKLRYGLIDHGVDRGRNISRPYLLTISGPLGAWILDPGFDLPRIAGIVDWINVMSYDYFGPWDSVYGLRTGPIAPLYFGAPPNANYSRQLTVDFTMKYYSCHVGDNSKLVMGLGFYGRYWNNSGEPFDPADQLWRRAIRNAQGGFDGGFLPYSLIKRDYRSSIYKKTYHEKTQTPYMLSQPNGTTTTTTPQPVFFMAYENQHSIIQKVFYAATKNFGGVAIRSVDYDDSSRTLLRTASSNVLCSWGPAPEFKCPPTTSENS